MKKRTWLIAFFLLVLCLLLSACAEGSSGESQPSDTTEDSSTVEVDPKPTHLHRYNAKDVCEICEKTFEDKGLRFTFNGTGGYVISDYVGDSAYVYIPTAYKGVPVVSIGESAFDYRNDIIRVVMPHTIVT